MNRTVTTLNLPKYQINHLLNNGFIFASDVPLEFIRNDMNLTIEEWIKLTASTDTRTALDLDETDTFLSKIVTFSNSLDSVLGGGISLESITEVTGLPGTGKTQFCLQLCLSVQLCECFGGMDGNCVFIDSTMGFNPHRLSAIARGCIKYCSEAADMYNSSENLQCLTEEKFLKRIHYIKALQLSQLLATVNMIRKLLIQNDSNVKLIIIDTITDPIKNSKLEYFDRIKLIYTFLSDLQKLAKSHKFAIVVVNDMTTKFDENSSSYGTSCLGDSFAHRINSKIELKHVSKNLFSAQVIKSVEKFESTATFQIIEDGIRNVESE